MTSPSTPQFSQEASFSCPNVPRKWGKKDCWLARGGKRCFHCNSPLEADCLAPEPLSAAPCGTRNGSSHPSPCLHLEHPYLFESLWWRPQYLEASCFSLGGAAAGCPVCSKSNTEQDRQLCAQGHMEPGDMAAGEGSGDGAVEREEALCGFPVSGQC